MANPLPSNCAACEIIAPSSQSDSLVSPVFDIIGRILGRVRSLPKVTVKSIWYSRLELAVRRKRQSKEKLPFQSRAGQTSWVSFPCIHAVDDFQGTPGTSVTGPILKADDARGPCGQDGSFARRSRVQRSCERSSALSIEREFAIDGRLSGPIGAVGRLVAERS